MEQKTHTTLPGKFDTQGARRLVFALAVSSTLGFWAIFSRGNQDQSANGTLQPTGDVPALQVESQLTLDLPPIPTLVPPISSTSPVVMATPITALPTPVVLTQPLAPKTDKSLSAGVKPRTVRQSPTTSTRSSK